MKHLYALAAIMLMSIPAVFAQEKKDDTWKERIKSEKIAFLTNEMSLTPEEAQVFWPVYNAVWGQRDKAQKAVMQAYRAMSEAVKAGKPEKEINGTIDAYVKSISDQAGMIEKHKEEFKKVLSAEKLAKLYLSEEKFRREQIHRLHHGGGPRKPQDGR